MKKKCCLMSVGLILTLGMNINVIIANAKTKSVERTHIVKAINKIKIYDGKVFNHARVVKSVKVGKKLLVAKLVHAGGMTRFELIDGHYITANKSYVELLNQ